MATIFNYKCDRCGFTMEKVDFVLRSSSERERALFIGMFYPGKEIDLCESCKELFQKWMLEGVV